jgi:hypothetical protein
MLRRFHEELERVGLRARRQHDTRRTSISIARADGARPDILRWATHGPTGDIVDDYTTLPWATLCEEVAKVRIRLLEGTLIELPMAAGGGGGRGGIELVGAVVNRSEQTPDGAGSGHASATSIEVVDRGEPHR